ncbi:MAG: cob(I)yrinic acid a,c-diamide adenosyltransferase [Gammaproteobacteria bacterium]
MGNRLSKIYTRTGDAGTTGLGDGTRVAKDHPRVEAYGSTDELNSAVGVILASGEIPEGIATCLTETQHDLFDLGGELCIPGSEVMNAAHVERLERELDRLNESLPPLREFVLPGGGTSAAASHMARTICRRAERRVLSLASNEPVNPELVRYLNRLSDLLFVIARVFARRDCGQEVLWHHQRGRKHD